MKRLRNWDNKTWLSSKKYISAFNFFLKKKVELNKNTKILDIGCGRANIISSLQKKYKFKNKPVGIDVIKNRNTKKNIMFYKKDALFFLKSTKVKFDLIIIKQVIHFFSAKQLKSLLKIAKSKLTRNGQILIFSLNNKNNQIPSFKKMKLSLDKSLKYDDRLFKMIRKNFKNSKLNYFKFKVIISKKNYLKMIKNRYISCLLNFNQKDLINGMKEINNKYDNKIIFEDILKCFFIKKY